MYGCPPYPHHAFSIWLLVITYPYHVNGTTQSKNIACERKCSSPLSRASFSSYSFCSFFLIVIGLGNSGIGFMASRRADTLILKINLSRRIKVFFQSFGPYKRSGSPHPVSIVFLSFSFRAIYFFLSNYNCLLTQTVLISFCYIFLTAP